MTCTLDPYTAEGRAALSRVVGRGTVADRILTALADQHARPALHDPELAHRFDLIAGHVSSGNVAAVAIEMAGLVDRARERWQELGPLRAEQWALAGGRIVGPPPSDPLPGPCWRNGCGEQQTGNGYCDEHEGDLDAASDELVRIFGAEE